MSDMDIEDDEGLEVIPDALDMFSSIPTQVGVKAGKYKRVDPIASLDNTGAIHFSYTLDDNEFLDISRTLMCVYTKVVDHRGEVIPSMVDADAGGRQVHNDRSNVTLVNGIGTAWFKSLTVKINGEPVERGDGMYAYRADLDNRLSYSKEAKECQLTMSGFDEEVYPFDDVNAGEIHFDAAPDAEDNVKARAFVRRYNRIKDSKRLLTYSRIHSGLFEQERPLPPRTRLDLIFERNDQDFVIMTKRPENERFVPMIDECYLLLRSMNVDEQICREIDDQIYNGADLIYHFRRIKMYTHARAGGNRDISVTDLCNGEVNLPRRIFMGMVKESANHGDRRQDPFNYQHYNLQYCKINVGGETRPYPELHFDFAEDDYNQALFTLLEATGTLFTDFDIGITYENYATRNVLLGANFTGCSNEPGEAYELPEAKQINISLRLQGAGLGGEQILIVVYSEYDAEMVISPEKRVTVHLDG